MLFLTELGAELLGDSMVLGDNAYRIIAGWLGTPVGTLEHIAPSGKTCGPATRPRPRTAATNSCWAHFSAELVMPELAPIAFYLGVVTYSAAATVFFLELLKGDASKAPGVFGPRLLLVGGAVHGLHVVAASLLSQACPVESLHFGLSLSALGAVVAYLLLRHRFRLHALGASWPRWRSLS